jgi:predicted ABC-type sugar transport system permease subunit
MDRTVASTSSESDKPLGPGDDGTVHGSRAQAVRHGMWRGAKVGFVAFCVALPGMCLAMLMFCIMFVPSTRDAAVYEIGKALHEAKQTSFPTVIGWTSLFFGGFGTLYGAIPGALIGGLVAAIRWRCPPNETAGREALHERR